MSIPMPPFRSSFIIPITLVLCIGLSPALIHARTTGADPIVAVLENAHIRVGIDTCTGSSTFGSVMSLFDKEHGVSCGKIQLFHVRAGKAVAFATSIIRCGADSAVFEFGKFGLSNLTVRFEYSLLNGGVALRVKAFSPEPADLPEGLFLDFYSDLGHLSCSNQFSNNFHVNIDTIKTALLDFNQILQFSDSSNSMAMVVRNPFHSHVGINTFGKKCHVFYLMQCAPPSTQAGTANAFSTIGNDTVVRSIEVFAGNSVPAPVMFCEHPSGFSNSVTMYWDDLPNHDTWTPLTSDTATDVKYYRFFLKMLKEDPSLKMGFLLLPDRLVLPETTAFERWKVNSPYVIADTMEKFEGTASMVMLSDSLRSLSACQDIPCKPNTAYSLSYALKSQGVVGTGVYAEVFSGKRRVNFGNPVLGDNSWRRDGLNFKTSSDDTVLSVYVRLQSAKGWAFFDDVRLTSLNSDTNLLGNSGFEQFVPGFMYDNPRRHWTDAHGPERLATKAPQHYLSFLQRLENHTVVYGWEDRVSIGCHGYHHTPSVFEHDPKYEFQYYDPYGDSLRMRAIFSEFNRIGLTKASLRYWRSPGFGFTKSLLDLLVDNGFVFFDAPAAADSQFGACMLQRGGKRMWLVNNGWWADYTSYKGYSAERLLSVLAQGHLAVIGGHPEQIFFRQSDSSFQRFKGVMSSAKRACPALGYVLPEEWADNAEAIYKLQTEGAQRRGDSVVFRFSGNCTAGNTVLYLGKCSNASLNGTAVPFREIQGVTYAVLPADSSGAGTVVFENAADNPPIAIRRPGAGRVPPGGKLAGAGGAVAAYTLRGQKISLVVWGKPGLIRRSFPGLGNGVYVLKTVGPDGKISFERFVIHR
jgi:hypothetical protein